MPLSSEAAQKDQIAGNLAHQRGDVPFLVVVLVLYQNFESVEIHLKISKNKHDKAKQLKT